MANGTAGPAQTPEAELAESPEMHSAVFHTVMEQLNEEIKGAKDASDLPGLQASLVRARAACAQGSLYWVGYEQRRARELVTAAEETVDGLARRWKPRQRFCFSQRTGQSQPTPESRAGTVSDKHPVGEPRATCTYINQEKATACGGRIVLKHDELNGRDVRIENMTDATIALLGVAGAIRIRNVERCIVVAGAVAGSVHVTGGKRSLFRLACRQVRVHSCEDCEYHLDVRSGPIIESCSKMRFGNGSVRFEGIERARRNAGLERGSNLWSDVKDFSWLRQTQSPNWTKVSGVCVATVSEEGEVVVAVQV